MLLPCLMMMQTRKPSTTTSVPSYGRTVSFKDRLFLLGDFNARVGLDAQTWPRFLGEHSVGNENSNGSLLLQTCYEHELAITNTYFQQANKYKTTWQHPRSKHWHMIDHVITRWRHPKDVHSTRAMRATGMWSHHRLVRSLVALELPPPRLTTTIFLANFSDHSKFYDISDRFDTFDSTCGF